jgi:hypothetical protein
VAAPAMMQARARAAEARARKAHYEAEARARYEEAAARAAAEQAAPPGDAVAFELANSDAEFAEQVASYASTHNGAFPAENPLQGAAAAVWTYFGGKRKSETIGDVLAYRAVQRPENHSLVLYTNLEWYLYPTASLPEILNTR